MRIAQQLYEGIDIGEGSVGLISYMRTDSVTLAAEAVVELRATISKLYGAEALAEEPRVYKTKSKNAQEAHEAIRPTSSAIVPADIEKYLDADQHKLYTLIWRRAVACQNVTHTDPWRRYTVTPARYDSLTRRLSCFGGDRCDRFGPAQVCFWCSSC